MQTNAFRLIMSKADAFFFHFGGCSLLFVHLINEFHFIISEIYYLAARCASPLSFSLALWRLCWSKFIGQQCDEVKVNILMQIWLKAIRCKWRKATEPKNRRTNDEKEMLFFWICVWMIWWRMFPIRFGKIFILLARQWAYFMQKKKKRNPSLSSSSSSSSCYLPLRVALAPCSSEIIGAFVFKATWYDGLTNFKPIVSIHTHTHTDRAMLSHSKYRERASQRARAGDKKIRNEMAWNILFAVFRALSSCCLFYQVMTAEVA